MSEKKLTLKEGLKIVFLFLCMIGTLLGFLISVLAFINWLSSGFDFSYLFASFFFFIVVVLPFSYVVKRYESVWKKFESRIGYVPPQPKEQLRTFVTYVGTLLLFFYLYSYFRGFVATAPENIGVELAKDILRNIVQVNGILIGLSGIIYVQLLRMKFSKTRINLAILIVTSALVISMLSSLSLMASTYNKTEIGWIEIEKYPLNFLLFGIVSFLISLSLITPSEKTENESAN